MPRRRFPEAARSGGAWGSTPTGRRWTACGRGTWRSWRHRTRSARRALHDRIRDGQIGEILALRTYRLQGPASGVPPRPAGMSEVLKRREYEENG